MLLYRILVFVLVTHGWLHAMDNNCDFNNKNRIKKSNKTAYVFKRNKWKLKKYDEDTVFNKIALTRGSAYEIDTCDFCNTTVKKNYLRHLLRHFDDEAKEKYCLKKSSGNFSLNEDGYKKLNELTTNNDLDKDAQPKITHTINRRYVEKFDDINKIFIVIKKHTLKPTKTCQLCNQTFKQTSSVKQHFPLHFLPKDRNIYYQGHNNNHHYTMTKAGKKKLEETILNENNTEFDNQNNEQVNPLLKISIKNLLN